MSKAIRIWAHSADVVVDTTDEEIWHQARMTAFGASEASVLLSGKDTSGYQNMIHRKAFGFRDMDFYNDHMARGHRLEDKALKAYCEQKGLEGEMLQVMFRHKHFHLSATLDAVIWTNHPIPVEVKTSNLKKPWKTIPKNYWRQVQQQIFILNWPVGYILHAYGLDEGSTEVDPAKIRMEKIFPDPAFQVRLAERSEESWEEVLALRERERDF